MQAVQQTYDGEPVHPDYKPCQSHLYVPDTKPLDPIGENEVKAYRKYMRALRRIRILQAREDPNAFIEYVFQNDDGTPFQQAWFHEDWQEFITNTDRALIIAPRAHGKTSQIIGRVLWELGNNTNLRIKIVCASDSKAVERLFEVIQYLEGSKRLHEVFPHLGPADRGDWTKHKIVVDRSAMHRDASIEALGIGSTATGGRCDLMIADDIVDRRNALQFPALRESTKQSWKSDWTQLIVPDGRIIYICTLWHKADLSHWLIKNPEYDVLRIDITDRIEPIWPEVWTRQKLLQRRREIGSTEFNRGFRNIAQDASDQIIKHEWIRYFDPDDLNPDDIFYITSYDLAYGKKQMHDYFSCVTFAVNQKTGKVYVVDAYHARKSAPDQEKQIVADWRYFRPEAVVVETVAAQESMAQYINANHPAINLIRHKPTIDKVNRMNGITMLLENGVLEFSEDLKPELMAYPERGDLISELFDFPIGSHDDMCDAFSQGLKYILTRYLVAGAWGNAATVEVIPL